MRKWSRIAKDKEGRSARWCGVVRFLKRVSNFETANFQLRCWFRIPLRLVKATTLWAPIAYALQPCTFVSFCTASYTSSLTNKYNILFKIEKPRRNVHVQATFSGTLCTTYAGKNINCFIINGMLFS